MTISDTQGCCVTRHRRHTSEEEEVWWSPHRPPPSNESAERVRACAWRSGQQVLGPDGGQPAEAMDVSTDTAALAPPLEPNKATSKPEVGDDAAAVEAAVRVTSREAATPAGEALKAPSGDQISVAAVPVPSNEDPLAEGQAPRAEGEAKSDDKPVADAVKPPADAEVASQTDDDLKDSADKPAVPAEPDAPPQFRPLVFQVGPGMA